MLLSVSEYIYNLKLYYLYYDILYIYVSTFMLIFLFQYKTCLMIMS